MPEIFWHPQWRRRHAPDRFGFAFLMQAASGYQFMWQLHWGKVGK